MVRDYDKRLNADSYRDDVQCEIRLQPDPRDETCGPVVDWVSERLLGRLRHLALAYELPLLGRLPGHGKVGYPEAQLSTLEEELGFLSSVVSDQVLLAEMDDAVSAEPDRLPGEIEAIRPMRDMIEKAQHDPRGWSLIVETS